MFSFENDQVRKLVRIQSSRGRSSSYEFYINSICNLRIPDQIMKLVRIQSSRGRSSSCDVYEFCVICEFLTRSGDWSESGAHEVAPEATISMLILFVICEFLTGSGSWSESRARDVAPAAAISILILFVSCEFWFENGVCFYTWAWLRVYFGIVARVGTFWFEMLCFYTWIWLRVCFVWRLHVLGRFGVKCCVFTHGCG